MAASATGRSPDKCVRLSSRSVYMVTYVRADLAAEREDMPLPEELQRLVDEEVSLPRSCGRVTVEAGVYVSREKTIPAFQLLWRQQRR